MKKGSGTRPGSLAANSKASKLLGVDEAASVPTKEKKKGSSKEKKHKRNTPAAALPAATSSVVDVKPFILDAIEYIEKNGTEVVGVFRLSGPVSEVQALRKAWAAGASYDLSQVTDISSVTSALKGYFRDLPEPLLTFDLYESFITATSVSDSEEARLDCIKAVIKKLPLPNRMLLYQLSQMLVSIEKKSSINQMTASNLAIVWTPNLLRPRNETIDTMFGQSTQSNTLIESFITDFELLFGEKVTGGRPQSEHAKVFYSTLRKGTQAMASNLLQEVAATAILSKKQEAWKGAVAPTTTGGTINRVLLRAAKENPPTPEKPATGGDGWTPARNVKPRGKVSNVFQTTPKDGSGSPLSLPLDTISPPELPVTVPASEAPSEVSAPAGSGLYIRRPPPSRPPPKRAPPEQPTITRRASGTITRRESSRNLDEVLGLAAPLSPRSSTIETPPAGIEFPPLPIPPQQDPPPETKSIPLPIPPSRESRPPLLEQPVKPQSTEPQPVESQPVEPQPQAVAQSIMQSKLEKRGSQIGELEFKPPPPASSIAGLVISRPRPKATKVRLKSSSPGGSRINPGSRVRIDEVQTVTKRRNPLPGVEDEDISPYGSRISEIEDSKTSDVIAEVATSLEAEEIKEEIKENVEEVISHIDDEKFADISYEEMVSMVAKQTGVVIEEDGEDSGDTNSSESNEEPN